MFPVQLTLWGKNVGVKQGFLQPLPAAFSPGVVSSLFWDRDMLGPAVKLACISQHPFCCCQKGSITLWLYRCLCTEPLSLHSPDFSSTSATTAWPHRLCLRAAGWHRPVGAGTSHSTGARSCSLLHEWLVQVAAPEQSLDQEGGKVAGMQEDTALAALVWRARAHCSDGWQGTALRWFGWTQDATPGTVLFLHQFLLSGQGANGHQLASASSCSSSPLSCSLDAPDVDGRGTSE